MLTNNYKRFSASFLVLFLVVSLVSAQTRKPAMVFAVSAEAGEGSMDAVVVVEGKRLRAPFTDEQKDLLLPLGQHGDSALQIL